MKAVIILVLLFIAVFTACSKPADTQSTSLDTDQKAVVQTAVIPAKVTIEEQVDFELKETESEDDQPDWDEIDKDLAALDTVW